MAQSGGIPVILIHSIRNSCLGLGIALGVLAASSAHAGVEQACSGRLEAVACTQRLDQAFSRAFHKEGLYSPLACHHNVWNLAKRLKRSGFRLSQFNVLYIGGALLNETVPPDSPSRWLVSGRQFDALAPRGGEARWIFHVVLETHGLILDLDYTDQPRLVPFQEYFASQFGLQALSWLAYRKIPATTYVRELSDEYDRRTLRIRNWAYFLYDTDGRFPLRPLSPSVSAQTSITP